MSRPRFPVVRNATGLLEPRCRSELTAPGVSVAHDTAAITHATAGAAKLWQLVQPDAKTGPRHHGELSFQGGALSDADLPRCQAKGSSTSGRNSGQRLFAVKESAGQRALRVIDPPAILASNERTRCCSLEWRCSSASGFGKLCVVQYGKEHAMRSVPTPISLAGSQLGETRHVCAFFNSDEEEYRVLLPFIKDGLKSGDKAVHVLNPEQRQDHLQRLAAAGINPAAAQQIGQLELRVNTDVSLPDGRFDQDRMLGAFEELASGNAPGGFPLSRICCRMGWAVEDRSHVDDVIEFESRVNDVWRHHDDAVICTYHLGQFGGDAVIDIMRTHPLVIVGGILQHNPFFVPPDESLREFRQRRASRGSLHATA